MYGKIIRNNVNLKNDQDIGQEFEDNYFILYLIQYTRCLETLFFLLLCSERFPGNLHNIENPKNFL